MGDRSAPAEPGAAGPPPALDRLIHEPARLLVMATLSVVDAADFVFLSHRTGLTAGNISSHVDKLERAGYVTVTKSFVGRRPRTTYALTAAGREAFERYRQQVGELLQPTTTGTA